MKIVNPDKTGEFIQKYSNATGKQSRKVTGSIAVGLI